MTKRLFAVDGHALCYRAYYAFIKNPLINSNGQNTSAIFGFARMLFKLIQEQKPDYVVVAFDPPGKTFRAELYPDYKANRAAMPEDLRSQIAEIKELVAALGLPRIEIQGFEADDVLGTIANRFANQQCTVTIVTGDKDALQLVNERVNIYANKKGIADFEMLDADAVIARTGLRPEDIIDYMALMGDTSDNVPGVKGIGEKTAQKLIGEYHSLENLYAHIDTVPAKVRDKLLEQRDMAYLSRKLVTIKTDVPFDLDLGRTAVPDFRNQRVKEYLERLEMKSLVKEIFGEAGGGDIASPRQAEPSREERDYVIIQTIESLEKALVRIGKAKLVSMDTETTSVHPVDAELVGISLAIAANAGWYIPLKSAGLFGDEILAIESVISRLKPMLEDPGVKKVGQNIKYDTMVLANYGIAVQGIVFDTMIASYLINPNERRHNLDDMAQDYLGYTTITYEQLVGTGKKAVSIHEVELPRLAEYAIEDADIAYRLYTVLLPKLREHDLEKLYHEVELPLVQVLATVETNGVRIDPKHFAQLSRENQSMLNQVEDEIYTQAGTRFNINSTRELADVLFTRLGLKPVKKTKTGYSTDISVLEELQGCHPVIEHLIAYRTYSKLKSTYIDTLPQLVSPKTGRIHTSYNQTVAATGRLSSSDPNLQNIPIRDEFGKKIRAGFVADDGCLLLSADYSQIELRLAAHLSGDETMMQAFRDNIDIHSRTAASVFGVGIDEVTADMRRQAKIINFSTIYGVSPFGLSRQADISFKDAADFINRYFETYPGFRRYIDETVAAARERGYVQTLFGRRRPVPDINSSVSFRREGAERIAINTPIQGTSADLIKIAMVRIQRRIESEKLESRMIMQVHDELVFEAPESEIPAMETLIRQEMEHAAELSVPLTVDIGRGKNWAEAH